MSSTVLFSFLGFLALFLSVGLASMRHRRKTADDYLVASRDMRPSMVGLSMAASTASGFGFTGIIGFGYVMGVSGFWFVIGIIVGSLIFFSLSARRFRVSSRRHKALSYTEYLGASIQNKTRAFAVVMGLVSLVAVTLYAAAQFTAGSKALHVLFGWDYSVGALIGAVMVLIYCWAGGIRASMWTDAVQIVVMYIAMTILMIVALMEIGGFGGLISTLRDIDPALVTILPTKNMFGPLLFILGCMSVGVSLIGFPHTMVRFMTLKKQRDCTKAIVWFEFSYGAFYVTAYIVALCTRVLIADSADFDKELALVQLSIDLLPEMLVGLMLAGIFAGTISTADSLIISSTSNLSRDLFVKYKDSYGFIKLGTLSVTCIALLMAVFGSKSVFDLVMFVVAIMGAGFAPLLVVRIMRWPITQNLAFAMVIGGLGAAVFWRMEGYHKHVFDSLPGMVVAGIIYAGGFFWLRYRKRKLA